MEGSKQYAQRQPSPAGGGGADAPARLPIVGAVGSAIPVELVIATQARYVALSADPDDYARDAAPMETGMEAEARSLFRQAITGAWSGCDLVVVASTSDGYRYLYQYLKEMNRTGEGNAIPPLVLYDMLFGDAEPVERYSRRVFDDLRQRLAMLTGQPTSDAALADAVAATDGVRERMREMAALRRAGSLSGTAAMGAMLAGRSLEPAEQAAMLADLIATGAEAITSPRLLLVSGVPLYHDRLHAVLEEAGGLVAAEDDGWTLSPDAPEIGSGDAASVFAHYRRWTPSPRQPSARQDADFDARLAQGWDGIVFYLPPEDQYYGWRYPALAARAQTAGIPTLLLRDEVLEEGGRDAIAFAAAAFVAGLERAA